MTHGDPRWPAPLNLICALLAGEPVAAPDFSDAEWSEFSDLAIERHRIAPTLVAALGGANFEPPEAVLVRLRDEARICGFRALAQRAESLRLAHALAEAGIGALWLKGWPLAEQLYGAPGLRHASDIDMLVAPDDRLRAAALLDAAGYVPIGTHTLRARLLAHQSVVAECKDLTYEHRESGLAVELHWRTNHFNTWPNLSDLGEAADELPGAEAVIRVPGPLGQLVYLSYHGQQHLFSRLKWLLDIAKLAEHRGDALAEDLVRAEAVGAGVPVRLALELARRVFGASVPDLGLSTREIAWADQIAFTIGSPNAAPGRLSTRFAFYLWHLRMAADSRQRLGVLRSVTWGRLRLRLAGLIQ